MYRQVYGNVITSEVVKIQVVNDRPKIKQKKNKKRREEASGVNVCAIVKH
jgi:hypothetical protein